MNASAVVGSLMLALFCSVGTLMGAAIGAVWLAVVCGSLTVFFVSLALTAVIPNAVDERLAQEEGR